MTVTVGGATAPADALTDAFARAKYVTMTDAQKLSAPSFEQMRSGARVKLDGAAAAPPVVVGWTFDQFVLTAHGLGAPTAQPFVPDPAAVANTPGGDGPHPIGVVVDHYPGGQWQTGVKGGRL